MLLGRSNPPKMCGSSRCYIVCFFTKCVLLPELLILLRCAQEIVSYSLWHLFTSPKAMTDIVFVATCVHHATDKEH